MTTTQQVHTPMQAIAILQDARLTHDQTQYVLGYLSAADPDELVAAIRAAQEAER